MKRKNAKTVTSSRRNGAPIPIITEFRNNDVDFTPPSQVVHPRVVRVEYKGHKVEIEEGLFLDGTPFLSLGVYMSDDNVFINLPPAKLDELLFAIGIARAEARQRRMPNLPREGAAQDH
jgi:hypothetical protein